MGSGERSASIGHPTHHWSRRSRVRREARRGRVPGHDPRVRSDERLVPGRPRPDRRLRLADERGNPAFLGLGLAPPAPPAFPPVPIPATRLVAVFAPAFTYVPVLSNITLTDSRSYFVQSTTKPLCDGAPIQITGGPLTFTLRVQTNPSGAYHCTYTVAGSLKVKTLSAGVVQDALISEFHRGMMTDEHGQVREEASQTLLFTDAAAGHPCPGSSEQARPTTGSQQNCAIE